MMGVAGFVRLQWSAMGYYRFLPVLVIASIVLMRISCLAMKDDKHVSTGCGGLGGTASEAL